MFLQPVTSPELASVKQFLRDNPLPYPQRRAAALAVRGPEQSPAEMAHEALLPAPGPPALQDPDRLLRDVRKFLRHFAVWPSEAALDVATLAVAAMHAKVGPGEDNAGDPVWEYAFKLLITAPEYGAGKSWLAFLIASLCPDPIVLLEPTKPSFMEEIARKRTIVIREVDKLLATAGRSTGIVAAMNGSYEPGGYTTKMVSGKALEIHVFGHQILDGRSEVFCETRDDTKATASRCIRIHVAGQGGDYRRPMWTKLAKATALDGRARLAAWMAEEVAAGMGSDEGHVAAVPVACVGTGPRGARKRVLYEPLFTVAWRADAATHARGCELADHAECEESGYWTGRLTEGVPALEGAIPAVTAGPVRDFLDSLPED